MHTPDDGGIKPDACHQKEIAPASTLLINSTTHMNLSRLPFCNNRSGLLAVKWQSQLPRQHVCRPARKYSQAHVGPQQPLQSLIDCAVTSGNDNIPNPLFGGCGGHACRLAGI